MSSYEVVRVEGLNEARAGLKAAGPAMRKEIKQQFKAVGGILAEEAKSIAESQGLRGTQPWDKHKGRLINSIKPTVGEWKVVVNETAKDPKGYRYPKIYEYGGSTHVSTYKKVDGKYLRTAVEKKHGSATSARLGLSSGYDEYHGARAFMGPALDAKRDEIAERMAAVTAAAAERFGNGGA